MNWQTPKLIAETLCLLAVGLSAAFFAWDTHQTQLLARAALTNSPAILSAALAPANKTITDTDQGVLDATASIRDIVIALLKPCPKPGKMGNGYFPPTTWAEGPLGPHQVLVEMSGKTVSGNCGLIPSLEQIPPPTVAAVNRLGDSSAKLGDAASALAGTARSATGTLDAARDDLVAAKPAIDALPPLVAQYTLTAKDVNALIMSDDVKKIIDSTATTSGNVAEMTTDSATWYHKWLHPEKKKLTFLGGVDATTLWFHSHILPPLF